MAFGIDDVMGAAAAGISLTDTIVTTIRNYKKKKLDVDLEILMEEVRLTALKRIDEADLALSRFERTMHEKGVDIDKRISDVIADTPFWRPFEQHRLTQIQKSFNHFSDSIYSAGDDISALVRCLGHPEKMGAAVAETAKRKHELHATLINAESLRSAIDILRGELIKHKEALLE